MNQAATPTALHQTKKDGGHPLEAIVWAALILGYALLTTCSLRATALKTVIARGVLTVATINSPTTYYVEASGPTGFEYDLAQGFAQRLGVKLEVLVADSPAQALQWVAQGKAQLAAAGLGISAARLEQVHFSQPLLTVVPQLVYAMGQSAPKNLGELQGRLRVARGSIAAEQLAELKRAAYPQLAWEETGDQEVEALLYQVAHGQFDYTIANSDIIAINQRYYPNLRVAFNLAASQQLAWAFPRSDDNSLYRKAGDYLQQASGGELARLRDRYFGHVKQVDYVGAVTLAADAQSRLPRYRAAFEDAAARAQLDWRLLAAMGYQESHWDADAVSPTGVRGLMMLTLDTAERLQVENREDPVQSIHGGARYFRHIFDQLPPEVPEPERSWMALAAYNMGMGHLLDARELTLKLGRDPNRWLDVRNSLALLTQPKWYGKLKYGYARGFEAVNYVGNVRAYYDMLVWLTSGGDGAPKAEEEPPLQLPEAEPPKKDPLDINTPVL